jgi:hypothetical protein
MYCEKVFQFFRGIAIVRSSSLALLHMAETALSAKQEFHISFIYETKKRRDHKGMCNST